MTCCQPVKYIQTNQLRKMHQFAEAELQECSGRGETIRKSHKIRSVAGHSDRGMANPGLSLDFDRTCYQQYYAVDW